MKRLFVGNVDFSLSKTELRTLFERHGSVASVSLVTARDTGQACACGFVEMPDDSEAESATTALNGAYAGVRPLIVNEARPKNRSA